ncbi:MAG: chorismate synthase [Cryomorphaceae bacterium]|jgi:chorismate synthase|nr:chorismate synthase [Cryomorphaceae bacterium]
MAGSTFGTIFKLTTFGESHGAAIGGVIDGVPAGMSIRIELVQEELDRRKPGQSAIVTQRKESDTVEFLSGLFEGKTTGTPIGFIIRNEDHKSEDYTEMKDVFRPSHADFTYHEKYGHRDYRGGGRSSARETACRVVAGSIAKQILATRGMEFSTYVDQIGAIRLNDTAFFLRDAIESNPVRCPVAEIAQKMEALIRNVRSEGDTIGGCVRCMVLNVPVGLGEPVFDKLHAELGKAMFSINAVKGVEFGSGFSSVEMRGSAHNDQINSDKSTKTNNSGGIQGGISNGMPIEFRVAFKPVATIAQQQETINVAGEESTVRGKGRHDACVVPRAVPIVESMAAIVLLDMLLRHQATRLV